MSSSCLNACFLGNSLILPAATLHSLKSTLLKIRFESHLPPASGSLGLGLVFTSGSGSGYGDARGIHTAWVRRTQSSRSMNVVVHCASREDRQMGGDTDQDHRDGLEDRNRLHAKKSRCSSGKQTEAVLDAVSDLDSNFTDEIDVLFSYKNQESIRLELDHKLFTDSNGNSESDLEDKKREKYASGTIHDDENSDDDEYEIIEIDNDFACYVQDEATSGEDDYSIDIDHSGIDSNVYFNANFIESNQRLQKSRPAQQKYVPDASAPHSDTSRAIEFKNIDDSTTYEEALMREKIERKYKDRNENFLQYELLDKFEFGLQRLPIHDKAGKRFNPAPFIYKKECERLQYSKKDVTLLSDLINAGKKPETMEFNKTIAYCCDGNRGHYVIHLLRTMRASKVPFNATTFAVSMYALINSGMARDCIALFKTSRKLIKEPSLLMIVLAILAAAEDNDFTYCFKLITGLLESNYFNEADSFFHSKLVTVFNQVIARCIILKENKLRSAAILLVKKFSAKGLGPDGTTYGLLISAYSMSGQVDEAMRLFSAFKSLGEKPSLVCFNALMNGLAIAGKYEDSRKLLKEMDNLRLRPNHYTFVALVVAHVNAQRFEHLSDLLFEMKKYKLAPANINYHCIISLLCKYGEWEQALMVVMSKDSMSKREDHEELALTIEDYHALLKGFEKGRQWRRAVDLLKKMTAGVISIVPNIDTYNLTLKVCLASNQWAEVLSIVEMQESDASFAKPDRNTYKIALESFGKASQTRLVLQIYHTMNSKNIALDEEVFYLMMSAFEKTCSWHFAFVVFEEMRKQVQPSIRVYNKILECCSNSARYRQGREILEIINRDDQVKKDQKTYYFVLLLLSRSGKYQEILDMYDEIQASGIKLTIHMYHLLMFAFKKLRRINQLFLSDRRIRWEPVDSEARKYGRAIRIAKKSGNLDECVSFLEEMLVKGLKPTMDDYLAVLKSYEQRGQWKESLRLLKHIRDKDGDVPTPEIYQTVMSVCDKNEQWNEVTELWQEYQNITMRSKKSRGKVLAELRGQVAS